MKMNRSVGLAYLMWTAALIFIGAFILNKVGGNSPDSFKNKVQSLEKVMNEAP